MLKAFSSWASRTGLNPSTWRPDKWFHPNANSPDLNTLAREFRYPAPLSRGKPNLGNMPTKQEGLTIAYYKRSAGKREPPMTKKKDIQKQLQQFQQAHREAQELHKQEQLNKQLPVRIYDPVDPLALDNLTLTMSKDKGYVFRPVPRSQWL